MALALLWYHDQGARDYETTLTELAQQLHQLSLTGPIRQTKIKDTIQRWGVTIVGKKKGTIRLSLRGRQRLTEHFARLLSTPSTSNHLASASTPHQTIPSNNLDLAAIFPLFPSSPQAPLKQPPPLTSPSSSKPRVFIGSSVEGLKFAENIQLGLDFSAEVTVWTQGVFVASRSNLENLIAALKLADFAVLVLTPDDLIERKGSTGAAPRDNVLFELGLFIGRLGRDRTFMVSCRDDALKLPSDLDGIAHITFGRRRDGNIKASIGPVCTELKTLFAATQTDQHSIS